MKKLLFSLTALTVFTFGLMSFVSNTSDTQPTKKEVQKEITMTIEKTDGSVMTIPLTLDEFKSLETSNLPSDNEVFKCSYQFSDGTCKKVARTCAEAKEEFEKCSGLTL